MWESILYNKEALQFSYSSIIKLTPSEWKKLEKLVETLKLLKEASDILEKSDQSISIVIPLLYFLIGKKKYI